LQGDCFKPLALALGLPAKSSSLGRQNVLFLIFSDAVTNKLVKAISCNYHRPKALFLTGQSFEAKNKLAKKLETGLVLPFFTKQNVLKLMQVVTGNQMRNDITEQNRDAYFFRSILKSNTLH
jgi:hypothetical protein